MFNNQKGIHSQATTPDLDSDGASILEDDAEGADAVIVDVDQVPTQKPHFLDYDAMPPADYELLQPINCGEQLKMDKKYERDGEISDYELAASGYTKKEFTQDDNTLHFNNVGTSSSSSAATRKQAGHKPKHFLDENPIAPDYMLVVGASSHEMREHRSLDRNFERQSATAERTQQEQQQQFALSQQQQRTASPATSLSGSGRKTSMDHGYVGTGSCTRSSRERYKEPSYTLSRFLDSDAQILGSPTAMLPPPPPPQSLHNRVPKGAAWTDSFDSRYSSLQLSTVTTSGGGGNEVDASLGSKVECVYSLLSMLGSNDPLEMSKKFFELSRNPETCTTLRRSGCIPLLVQMMHSTDGEDSVRKCAGMALHNVVHCHPDEKAGRREAKVLRLLDQIMDYCNFLKTLLQSGGEAIADDSDRHPLAAISSLMKVSFDEEHRHAMCELGALQAIPNLVHLDHAVHGPKPEDQCCNSLRRYALMALTNLTFGDENNKALLCSQTIFMEALVAQLDSAPDDLLQVTASVLRNLSWRADNNMKAVLNKIGTVTVLARAAMKNKCENTLKAILSALWNLSAHCSTNKAEFCAVEGALAFLVNMLTYEGPSKTLKIIENAGGILRNVSSHIAVCEPYRQILRENNCLSILLQQLKSESLTVVSNSCGTLWNLSARCPEDQKFLWDNGAVPMLRSLIHSKHAMISEGSSSALKNLLNFRPSVQNQNPLDPIARSMGLKQLPTLNARKQKALEQELGEKVHAETCDNLDIGHTTASTSSPGLTKDRIVDVDVDCLPRRYPLVTSGGGVVTGAVAATQQSLTPSTTTTATRLTRSAILTKSESRDSVFSAKSDSVYENFMRSQSASDANRKTPVTKTTTTPTKTYAVSPHSTTAYELDNDAEPTEEQPIDYSVKYNENSTKVVENLSNTLPNESSTAYGTYQETDLDQPTDFSLRYAENQIESDVDISPPEVADIAQRVDADVLDKDVVKNVKQRNNETGEILLILEDSVKCYQTEDTPYVISNAASVTDLRQTKGDVVVAPTTSVTRTQSTNSSANVNNGEVVGVHTKKSQQKSMTQYVSGSYTPEKPINYCEEGTPGYFSRYDSLSSLDEAPNTTNDNAPTNSNATMDCKDNNTMAKKVDTSGESTSPIVPQHSSSGDMTKPTIENGRSNINSAQETPLMFSRHSSMDSFVIEDVGPCDDKSSIVSDFSRLASGVISPSEIPDSPTQSMPQSPRRNSAAGQLQHSPSVPRSLNNTSIHNSSIATDTKRPLRSVFEDDLNLFNVENTPAQFSCATSLSNLSIMDEEHASSIADDDHPNKPETTCDVKDSTIHHDVLQTHHRHTISEGEEDETNLNNDDYLLASCINIGMNRSIERSTLTTAAKGNHQNQESVNQTMRDEPCHYFTEDTPALLSKVGSNTNLSAISICSSNNELKDNTVYEVTRRQQTHTTNNSNRYSLNLSDDMSSNASESGAVGAQSFDILQQCIRDGMKKPNSNNQSANIEKTYNHAVINPIDMLRRGGADSLLPPYLQVTDEINKYLVEDSPCNFSVVSGLSNLTVGSSLVGPAVQLQKSSSDVEKLPTCSNKNATTMNEDVSGEHQQWQDDSLSSLSIDSEDDTNLLSQAIAAGCNRPKSNLGFSSTASTKNKRSTSLSSSQPIPINTSSALNAATATNTTKQQNKLKRSKSKEAAIAAAPNNESYSSVESSDSNDNQQSKSLFELCILSGMYKSRGNQSSRKQQQQTQPLQRGGNDLAASSTQSNPNLKQFESLPVQLMQPKSLTPNRQHRPHHHHHHHNHHQQRERERKDEKLLMECINTGISKKIGGNHQIIVEPPKNVLATSAAALEQCHPMADTILPSANNTAAPGVEMNQHAIHHNHNHSINNKLNNSINRDDTIDAAKNQRQQRQQKPVTTVFAQCVENLQSPVNIREKIVKDIGFNCKDAEAYDNSASDESTQSFIMETTVTLEPQQDELPTASITADKHKDPDLMLKSVERLTLEFVSSAEQLRFNNLTQQPSNNFSINTQRAVDGRAGSVGGGTSSNNTWNESTCPNDISFPSVSISAPILASLSVDDDIANADGDDDQATEANHKDLHDFAEITPTNESESHMLPSLDFVCGEPLMGGVGGSTHISLDTETDTLLSAQMSTTSEPFNSAHSKYRSGTNSGISFQLGGKVQSAAAVVAGNRHSHSFYNGASMTMTDSTMIAFEARALAENLQQLNNAAAADDDEVEQLTFSLNSLDLDKVRPPSGMESLNISQPNSLQHSPALLPGMHMPNSPQFPTKSPKFPRKTLTAGFLAKRALGQLAGSAESVNSSYNMLDNIKPPSLMDELLDSMISVSSIQSEIADGFECIDDNHSSMATTISVSNYETAAGINEFDDNTVTLQSCYENMPHDDDNAAEHDDDTINDYSSAESTPKKFSTNSPLSHAGVKRTLTPKQKRKLAKDRYKTYTIAADIVLADEAQRKVLEVDETLCIEVIETSSSTRRDSQTDRYKTQTITYPNQEYNDDCPSEDISTICAMKHKFTYIYDANIDNPSSISPASTIVLDDYNSLEAGDQNSETESCHGIDDEQRIASPAAAPHTNNELNANVNEINKPVDKDMAPAIDKFNNANIKGNDNDKELEQHQNAVPSPSSSPVKSVRGRKKPAYISPYSMQYQQRTATSNVVSIIRPSSNSNRSKLTTLTLPVNTKRNGNIPNNSQLKKITQTNKTVELAPSNAPRPLERQGTFVKNEPTNITAQVPIVEMPSPTHRASKLPTKQRNTSSCPITTTITTPKRIAASSIQQRKATTATINNTTVRKIATTATIVPQRSNTNIRLPTTNLTSRLALHTTRISTTTPPSRSNSNLNGSNVAAQNAVAKINHTQSRIANIWKRVDDAKTKQQHQQHTKSQIKTSNISSNLKTQKTKSSSTLNGVQKPETLIRSTTFDNTSPNATALATKASVKCKLPTVLSSGSTKGVRK